MNKNILILIFSTAIAILIGEGFLRLITPYTSLGIGWELEWMRNSPVNLTEIYTVDTEFGFRPILGTKIYNQYGTLSNNYSITKKKNVKRLLFIGDSVTARGKIISGLKKYYGEADFEYWNAGVESFNTVQEVRFYEKYNSAINPDHVILTFHLNDFEITPVAFYHNNKLVVYAPDRSISHASPWLIRYSYVYRALISAIFFKRKHGEVTEEIATKVESSLSNLAKRLSKHKIAFTMIILPTFLPYEEWPAHQKEGRNTILSLCEKLNVKCFDLLDQLNTSINKGINVQETKGDDAHPSEEIANVFANYLYKNNML